jgi:two-component system sensor histidine kinase/response regulator
MSRLASRAASGFIAGWLIMLGLGITACLTTHAFITAATARRATFVDMAAMSDLMSDLKDAETGQRGYLLTGRETYLVPYDRAVDTIPRDLLVLGDLAKVEPALASRMQRITVLTSAKLAELAVTIDLRRSGHAESALAVVLTNRGHDTMTEIRSQLGDAEAAVSTGIEQRESGLRERAKSALIAIPAGSAVGLAFLALAAWLVFRDARRREKAEADLAQFFTVSLDMLCIAGFDGYFKRLSPAWQSTLGWSEDELMARPFLSLVHPDDREATSAEASKLAMGAKTISFENRYLGKDGKYRTFEWRSVPSVTKRTIFATARDTSARRELETELRRARTSAEESSRAKSEFLANMSHEIRTPINGILGMAELLSAMAIGREQIEYVEMIRSSSEALLAIVNSILDFSRVEAGGVELEEKPFDLRESVGDTMRALAIRAHEKKLELAFRIAADVPDSVVGDAGRLRQVLVNLVGNAIKFTASGEIVVSVALEQADSTAVRLRFDVKDTGIGIDSDKQAVVFESFVQADSSIARKFGGTGLGLAICSNLVKLMEGRIWVESHPGKGSTFSFQASFRPDASGFVARAARIEADLAGLPVLVVDDNDTNQSITMEVLHSWRMKPRAVGSKGAALATLRAASKALERLPLVLVDLNTPKMDGLSLVRHIRQDPGLAELAVIMVWSGADPGMTKQCEALGVTVCLSKPIKQSTLLDGIRAARARRAPSAAISSAMLSLHVKVDRPLDLLVAEDNKVNQVILVRMLESSGHRVQLAANGRDAIEASRNQRFDLIFMDVQMPEMSGEAAMAAIRSREAGGPTHVPIIAVTAHALKGDREKCLAMGADGYVSKPIRRAELFAAMDALLVGRKIHDRAAFLRLLQGDEALARELVATFIAEAAVLGQRLGDAIDRHDIDAAQRVTHSLVGSLAPFHAATASAIAADVDERVRHGRLEPGDLPRLAQAISELTRALAAGVAGGSIESEAALASAVAI